MWGERIRNELKWVAGKGYMYQNEEQAAKEHTETPRSPNALETRSCQCVSAKKSGTSTAASEDPQIHHAAGKRKTPRSKRHETDQTVRPRR